MNLINAQLNSQYPQQLNVFEIRGYPDISQESVVSISDNHLGMRKLPTRSLPLFLIFDKKRKRESTSKECLALFNTNSPQQTGEAAAIATVIFTKQSDAEEGQGWPIGNKYMPTNFWNVHGIIHIDYLQKRKISDATIKILT